jgi:hypothetical protein
MDRSEKEGEMNIWKKLSAGLMTGLVVPAAFTSPKTRPRHVTSGPSLAGTGEFIVLFGPLTPEIARKLPPHLKAAGPGATSPTTNRNRRLQMEALALIARAIEYIDREGSVIDRGTVADYREG